jgi:hypothetical protein
VTLDCQPESVRSPIGGQKKAIFIRSAQNVLTISGWKLFSLVNPRAEWLP